MQINTIINKFKIDERKAIEEIKIKIEADIKVDCFVKHEETLKYILDYHLK